jgi:3-methyladenine DNA glycosylase AlkD
LTSEVTARARALVAERKPTARELGERLAGLIDDPEAFVAALRKGFRKLADEPYAREQQRVAPGSGAVFGVRWPLIGAVETNLRRPLAQASAASALSLAQRLAAEPEREARLFSHLPLRRSLANDPERSWQLMRRLARAADDWISVDSLAGLYARGILAEPFRWAELEQLVYSTDRWERRLVGATIATIPFRLPRARRTELAGAPGLELVGSLIGDAEPDVQKSLSWALRSWTEVDTAGVERFIRDEARTARATTDGQRAWVLRDALSAPRMSAAVRRATSEQLAGLRRRPGAAATSTAAGIAAAFSGTNAFTERALAVQGERQQLRGRVA